MHSFCVRWLVFFSWVNNKRLYARFFDPKTGKESTQKSVEKLAKELKIQVTSKVMKESEAQRICALAIDAGLIYKRRALYCIEITSRSFGTLIGTRLDGNTQTDAVIPVSMENLLNTMVASIYYSTNN